MIGVRPGRVVVEEISLTILHREDGRTTELPTI